MIRGTDRVDPMDPPGSFPFFDLSVHNTPAPLSRGILLSSRERSHETCTGFLGDSWKSQRLFTFLTQFPGSVVL